MLRPDGLDQSQQRFGMSRRHVTDPVHVATDLRVEVQALGRQSAGATCPLRDEIASTALFSLDAPVTARPVLPDADALRTQDHGDRGRSRLPGPQPGSGRVRSARPG